MLRVGHDVTENCVLVRLHIALGDVGGELDVLRSDAFRGEGGKGTPWIEFPAAPIDV